MASSLLGAAIWRDLLARDDFDESLTAISGNPAEQSLASSLIWSYVYYKVLILKRTESQLTLPLLEFAAESVIVQFAQKDIANIHIQLGKMYKNLWDEINTGLSFEGGRQTSKVILSIRMDWAYTWSGSKSRLQSQVARMTSSL